MFLLPHPAIWLLHASVCSVTAMCLDDRKRKLITGHLDGQVKVWNYKSGAYMKDLVAHMDEVSDARPAFGPQLGHLP